MSAIVRELAWTVLAIAVSVVCFLVALVIGGAADDAFGESAVVRLSVAAGVWPLLASLTSLALARPLLAGGYYARLGSAIVVGILGSAAAAISAASLVVWTEDHFVRFDPEYIGPTFWLPVVAGIGTVGATLMLGLKGRPAGVGILGLVAAGALISGLALLNLYGLLNGVTTRGIPLVLAFVSAGAVVFGGLAYTIVVIDRAMRGGSGRGGTGRGGPRGE